MMHCRVGCINEKALHNRDYTNDGLFRYIPIELYLYIGWASVGMGEEGNWTVSKYVQSKVKTKQICCNIILSFNVLFRMCVW